MDDEEIIKIVVGQMLKSLGYEYDFVENGEQAVEKYTNAMSSGEAFDRGYSGPDCAGRHGRQRDAQKIA